MAKSEKLTNKQAVFLQNYFANPDGLQTDAMLAAGYSPTTVPATIWNAPSVKKAVKKIRDNAEKKAIITFEEKLQMCANMARKCEKEGDPKGLAAMVHLMNKMQGHNSAETIVNIDMHKDADLTQVLDVVNRFKRDY